MSDDPAKTPIRSSRIQRLARDLESGRAHVLDEFWRDLEREGAPLVEPLDGDDERVLVTFVYRGVGDTNAVAAIGWIAGVGSLPLLTRLMGSDVWYHTVAAPRGVRTAYCLLPNPPATDIIDMQHEWAALLRDGRIVTDPLNARTFQCGALSPIDSVLELPGAEPQPWLAERDVPRGTLAPHRFESEVLGGARVVWTYEPPGYDATAQHPVLVLFDGYGYANMSLQHTLDNLIAEREIPPMVCALYQSAERNEELACNDSVVNALADDLMRNWLPARLSVTADPARTIIGGMSLGGLAAMHAALRRPDAFGNVISQSGSFWWGPGTQFPADMADKSIEWEWLTREAAIPAKSAIRAFMEVGVLETSPAGGRMPDMIMPNRRMRDALIAAGHDVVTYREFNGGHDYVCWRGSIADALIAIAGPWMV
jgi:enterochelin esterase family protein